MAVSSNKTIIKNTIFLYIRLFVTMLVSLFTVRIVMKTLGVVDYGVYNVIGGVITSIAFISGVLSNASQRFFSVEIGKGNYIKLNKTFNLLLLGYGIVAVAIFILTETVGLWFLHTKMDIPQQRMDASNWVYQFAVLSFIVTLLSSPFQSIIIAHEKMKIYAYMSILDVVLKLLIVYILLILSGDKLKLYAVLMFIVSLLHGMIYIYISRHKFKETYFQFVWDKKEFKSIFNYSSWILIGCFSYVINNQGVNILFNLFFGPIANAAYAIGNQIRTVVVSFASSFFTATRPPIIKSYAQQDFSKTLKLFYFSSKIIFILLFVLIAPIFVEIEPVLELWLGNVSPYMPNFVRLMLIFAIVLSMSEPITAIVQSAGKVKKYHGTVETFSLISLPIIYCLFKLGFSAYWGFGVSIIVFVVTHIIRLFILKSFFNFSIWEYCKRLVIPIVLSVLIISFLMIGVCSFWGEHVLFIIALSVVFAILLSWIIVLDKEDRTSIIYLIKSKFSRRIINPFIVIYVKLTAK